MGNALQDEKQPSKKNLADRAKEFVKDILEALEDLVTPQPEMIPIPVDRHRRRR
jgi:hypothetical protein